MTDLTPTKEQLAARRKFPPTKVTLDEQRNGRRIVVTRVDYDGGKQYVVALDGVRWRSPFKTARGAIAAITTFLDDHQ